MNNCKPTFARPAFCIHNVHISSRVCGLPLPSGRCPWPHRPFPLSCSSVVHVLSCPHPEPSHRPCLYQDLPRPRLTVRWPRGRSTNIQSPVLRRPEACPHPEALGEEVSGTGAPLARWDSSAPHPAGPEGDQMARSWRRGGPGALYPSQGRLALPLWGSKEPWGAERTSRRKSLYFLRTNGNKRFLFISWRIVPVGVGLGAGVNSFSPGSDCLSSAGAPGAWGAAFLSCWGGGGAEHKSKLRG